MVKQDASDMYLTVGYPASIRNGKNNIKPISKSLIKNQDIEYFIKELLPEEKQQEFYQKLELNYSLARSDGSRFRFNFFKQQTNYGIVIRKINTTIPTAKEIGIPNIYCEMATKESGLIVLASPAGSGKSTSMAAMIGYLNENSSGHILTIEDPIEFVHERKNCIITQREIGTDTLSYEEALHNALRQRADVIAIGEVRDKKSMSHALRFAETGHLCIITVHSNTAAQAVDRMINMFPEEARPYILNTLSHNLLAVFSQKLVENIKDEFSLASEILLNRGLIKNLIADDKLEDIKDAMERGKNAGMQTFDQALVNLYINGEISLHNALEASDNPAGLKMKISQSGASAIDILGAKNDDEF